MSAPPAGLPRLLAGLSTAGPIDLDGHLDVHGPLPSGRAGIEDLASLVRSAGLRGRGGASFPLAVKLAAVASERRRPTVVVNGAESEPASAKDALLLDRVPHLVLDGAQLAAEALGASETIVCVKSAQRRRLERALSERGRSSKVRTRVVELPAAYLSGQESALINHLNGGDLKPTLVPPRPFQRGINQRPTLVNNAETLAHVALIARHGADWFRSLGSPNDPGSTLVTISGAVMRPGVLEIERGIAVTRLIEAAGGSTGPLRAVLVGGYFGAWLDAALIPSLALAEEELAPLGASLGSGVVVALPAEACPVAETARVLAYLERESAGQCGPCRFGLRDIAWTARALTAGTAHPTALTDLERWSGLIPGRGACHLPDGAARFATSALRVFAAEFADHLAHGPCEACGDPRVLRIPSAQRAEGAPGRRLTA